MAKDTRDEGKNPAWDSFDIFRGKALQWPNDCPSCATRMVFEIRPGSGAADRRTARLCPSCGTRVTARQCGRVNSKQLAKQRIKPAHEAQPEALAA